ncbi:hypothetical protein [Zavarzinella formosa]|uniref:hypothetical protein n=1 Tax=Zavarzinella formosa TaxID=360055 RepID=UPI00030AEB2E|nr:hypothetical protein [Zavarzinella formosa]
MSMPTLARQVVEFTVSGINANIFEKQPFDVFAQRVRAVVGDVRDIPGLGTLKAVLSPARRQMFASGSVADRVLAISAGPIPKGMFGFPPKPLSEFLPQCLR